MELDIVRIIGGVIGFIMLFIAGGVAWHLVIRHKESRALSIAQADVRWWRAVSAAMFEGLELRHASHSDFLNWRRLIRESLDDRDLDGLRFLAKDYLRPITVRSRLTDRHNLLGADEFAEKTIPGLAPSWQPANRNTDNASA